MSVQHNKEKWGEGQGIVQARDINDRFTFSFCCDITSRAFTYVSFLQPRQFIFNSFNSCCNITVVKRQYAVSYAVKI